MKRIFTLFFLSFFFTQIAFSQSEKTFVKSLVAHTSNVVVDLEGAATVTEWNEKFIRVTTTVEVTNFSDDILKRLVAVGRYEITGDVEDGVMIVRMPKLATKVTIKGQLLEEIMTYEVFVPEGITVEMATEDTPTTGVN